MSLLDHITACLANAEENQQRQAEVAWRGPLLCRLSVLDEMLARESDADHPDRVAELSEKVFELEDELGLR